MKRLKKVSEREITPQEYVDLQEQINNADMFEIFNIQERLEKMNQDDMYVKLLMEKIKEYHRSFNEEKDEEEQNEKDINEYVQYSDRNFYNENPNRERRLVVRKSEISLLPEEKIEEIIDYIKENTNNPEEYTRDCSTLWSYILSNGNLSEEFLEKYSDTFSKQNWRVIVEYQKISGNLIKKHEDKIDFDALVDYGIQITTDTGNYGPIDPVETGTCEFVLEKIQEFKNQYDEMKKYHSEEDNEYYDTHDELAYMEEKNKEYDQMIENISIYGILTEELMDKYRDILDWLQMSGSQKMSEKFILKNMRHYDMGYLSYNPNADLSEKFIKQYLNYGDLNVEEIVKNQSLSEEFLFEIIDKTEDNKKVKMLKNIFEGPSIISNNFLERYMEIIDEEGLWSRICEEGNLPISAILKHPEKMQIVHLMRNEKINQKEMRRKKIYYTLKDYHKEIYDHGSY